MIVSRRRLLHLFQIPGLIAAAARVLPRADRRPVDCAQWGIFLVGHATIAQFSFWGNYLPRVYPTHLRGTGESFAANVGGRMIGTCAALVTTQLVPSMPGRDRADQARLRVRRSSAPTRLRDRLHRELLAARAAGERPARLIADSHHRSDADERGGDVTRDEAHDDRDEHHDDGVADRFILRALHHPHQPEIQQIQGVERANERDQTAQGRDDLKDPTTHAGVGA